MIYKFLAAFFGAVVLVVLTWQFRRAPLACWSGGGRSISDYTSPQKSIDPQNIIPEMYEITTLPIRSVDDLQKIGEVHSRIFHHSFTVDPQTSGISRNVLRVEFEKRAEIIGMLVSADHSDPHIILAEFEARINSKNSGYGLGPSDALIHTSYACRGDGACQRNTDQHVWFGKNSGFKLCGKDWVAFGAWLSNTGTEMTLVHPEFIIYYRWL